MRGSSFADAYGATLPAVHRYLYRGTGGDAPLIEELTGATFLAAARWATLPAEGEPVRIRVPR